MHVPSLEPLDIVVWLAWLFPIVFVVHYRLVVVPSRLREIEDLFVGPKDGGCPIKDRPGYQYFRALKQFEKLPDVEPIRRLIRSQFSEFQSWPRYLLALALIGSLSAAE